MSQADIAKLKRQGYINQSDREFFTIRIKICAGNINAEQMKRIADIANEYGRGYAGLTTRLGIEIPWVRQENLEKVKAELEAVKLAPGGTGPTVRPIVACKGTICTHGLGDTQGLCGRMDEKYFAMELAAKCKIGIAGCPNNCSKAQLNDLGFMGQCIPKTSGVPCKSCNRCVSVCKMKAIALGEGKVNIDFSRCINCGDCTKACAAGAIVVDRQGFTPFLGGKFGRKYRIGERTDKVLSIDEAVVFTGKVLEYCRKNANKGERLSDMADRIGVAKLLQEL